jgi:hypothetical protein
MLRQVQLMIASRLSNVDWKESGYYLEDDPAELLDILH